MNYPLTLSFKFWTLGQQIRVLDAAGALICQVKQKAFRLKEDVVIFADEAQTQQIFRIRADRMLDITSTVYRITTPDERTIGAIKREGLKSLWKATYQLLDAAGTQVGTIREENPWIKVADALVSELPIVGIVAQRFINPAFLVEMPTGQVRLRAQKVPSFLERRFEIRQLGPMDPQTENLMIPAVMMMILMERARG